MILSSIIVQSTNGLKELSKVIARNINGSMKEFSEDIENRMDKAFKSKAGKIYGLSENEIRRR